MTLTASRIPATDTGIVCASCSTFTVKIRHASVAAVRACQGATVAEDVVNKINTLPPVPGAPAAAPTVLPEVPAGRYAVGPEDHTKFYKIDRPTEGRWAGRVFVSVQASDEFHPVRDRAARIGILAAIATDAVGASRRYGRELGVCGVCGRTLTDPDSISAGIGPICAGRF